MNGGLVYGSSSTSERDVLPPDGMPRGVYGLCGDCRSRQPVLEEHVDLGGIHYARRYERPDTRCSSCPTRMTDASGDFSPEPTKRRPRWRRKTNP